MNRTTRRHALSLLGGALALPLATPARAADRRFRIVMVTFRGWTASDQGFKDYLARRRIAVDLIHRDLGSDLGRLPAVVDEIKASRPDLVYTWGTGVSRGVIGPYDAADTRAHVTDIPTVFLNVTDPVASKLLRDETTPTGRNVAGSLFLVPIHVQLHTLLAYRPVSTIGVTYDPGEAQSRGLAARLRALAEPLDVAVVERPVDTVDGKASPASLPAVVSDLKSAGVQFVYIPADSFLSRHAPALTEAAIEAGLPCFAAAEGTFADSKALVGLFCRYYNLGQLAGRQAERILVEGADPATMPVGSLSQYSLTIRMPVARRLKLYPPMALLKIAQIERI